MIPPQCPAGPAFKRRRHRYAQPIAKPEASQSHREDRDGAKREHISGRCSTEESGQAIIEMALALPMLLLLLCGIYSLSIVLFGLCNVTLASRMAARYASVHSNISLVPATTASVSGVVTPYLLGARASATPVNVVYSPNDSIGSTVQVQVTATYPVVMPFTRYSSFTIASTAERTITR